MIPEVVCCRDPSIFISWVLYLYLFSWQAANNCYNSGQSITRSQYLILQFLQYPPVANSGLCFLHQHQLRTRPYLNKRVEKRVCLARAEEVLYFFKISSLGWCNQNTLSVRLQEAKSEQAEVRDRSCLRYHLGSSFSSSDAVESPTTRTGSKCTTQPGCQTPAA